MEPLQYRRREKNEVVLTVADTGNGIDETFREQIFEPFFRVDKSRSRELGGVGLGLALVREIVRVHDGKIEVRGNEQGGTTFEVRMRYNRIMKICKETQNRKVFIK